MTRERKRQLFETIEEHSPGVIMDPNKPLDCYLDRIYEATVALEENSADASEDEVESLKQTISELQDEISGLNDEANENEAEIERLKIKVRTLRDERDNVQT